jgi:hypothetical protein
LWSAYRYEAYLASLFSKFLYRSCGKQKEAAFLKKSGAKISVTLEPGFIGANGPN